jgi:hypothetical protein
MKPSALRIQRLLAKVEAEFACSARPRRYCFYFDEESEAKAQGLPYALVPQGTEPCNGRRNIHRRAERPAITGEP